MADLTVKQEFQGKHIVVGNKKIALSKDLSQKEAQAIVAAGAGVYFEGNPSPEQLTPKVVKLTVLKKGKDADEIIASQEGETTLSAAEKKAAKDKEAAEKKAAKDNAKS